MAAKSAFAGAISKSSLRRLAGERYFERGADYFDGGAVVHLRSGEEWIAARVQGTETCPYAVRFWLEKQDLQWGCTCPLGLEGEFCKHLVATGLAWLSGEIIEHESKIPELLETIRASWIARTGTHWLNSSANEAAGTTACSPNCC